MSKLTNKTILILIFSLNGCVTAPEEISGAGVYNESGKVVYRFAYPTSGNIARVCKKIGKSCEMELDMSEYLGKKAVLSDEWSHNALPYFIATLESGEQFIVRESDIKSVFLTDENYQNISKYIQRRGSKEVDSYEIDEEAMTQQRKSDAMMKMKAELVSILDFPLWDGVPVHELRKLYVKDVYESTNSYAERLTRDGLKQTLFLEKNVGLYSYDSDSEVALLTNPVDSMDGLIRHIYDGSDKNERLYIKFRDDVTSSFSVGSNAFGATRQILTEDGFTAGIFIKVPWESTDFYSLNDNYIESNGISRLRVNISPIKAKSISEKRNTLVSRFGFRLCTHSVNCFFEYLEKRSATIQSPVATSIVHNAVLADVQTVTYYIKETGEILHHFRAK